MIIQLCGLSGAGKTTLALAVKALAEKKSLRVDVIDGDQYRKTLCKDLGFSREDRTENLKRLTKVAFELAQKGRIAIISAIHPYRDVRMDLKQKYPDQIKTVFVDCPLESLIERDTKGLYKRALLPDNDPDKLRNLTGMGDSFEQPLRPDLHLRTDIHTVEQSAEMLFNYILDQTILNGK
ncbi:adenylyl-sulfate kinase [Arachidicoccus ginsenosidivorans]|uniref:Adenylyl-sulfate kinase n=1 Tax=Arachidicoccus ginsenosidivorans TaxID=496057 RepID=A0A5B8VJ77_9BACT|nr:adenylyl-sulfate kinase [Arachidicoccus ginsenosidivorans]QEC71002.1 adenylyl-sulfate kinase [Arachidicoccus ginsenosidivorans]